MSGLAFFVCLVSCNRSSENARIEIRWKEERARSIIIPAALIGNVPDDSTSASIMVSLAGKPMPVPIFGSYNREGDDLEFSPLIPFTPGMRYHVYVRGQRAGDFEIPENKTGNALSVTAIYPSADTLPENLLKIYLHFDHPMREGLSNRYVKLIKNRRDTVEAAFLDLQPELWNPDRTILTLWLDPGRIKRDLQPNKRLGAPMQQGTHYEVWVSEAWTDTRGKALEKPFRKAFVTTEKDSLSPTPASWTLGPPAAATRQPLEISFKESMDHSLLQEVFSVQGKSGVKISGQWQTGDHEKQVAFIPTDSWKAGSYQILIETRLEDLAGNNLLRPFDRDITKKAEAASGEIGVLRFNIK
ncbi:hypothetical protein GCM10010967_13410 [Dyadobacter beijingensis]|uniref:SbsA Ig-like domain-containing protein n=1 Tax=Dyadobacter beijingensis TaxID=365489 RepID=A0ABQ2HLF9_9BACT|nr:Ig-like domain-containing protein [Dyadobacter beijingensis]GGM83032.1 hypothetical protein GCM10010967_13410 [Dyadobacter beijingensis]